MGLAYLSVGSNLGDRLQNCRLAVSLLDHSPGVRVVSHSGVYETDPEGLTEQPRFLNLTLAVETEVTPRALLGTCKQIEAKLGRTAGERWGPRVIDLDLLLVEAVVIVDSDLVLPHPRMHRRRFVLAPLAEIAPDVQHPQLGKTANELLLDLGESGGRVKRFSELW